MKIYWSVCFVYIFQVLLQATLGEGYVIGQRPRGGYPGPMSPDYNYPIPEYGPRPHEPIPGPYAGPPIPMMPPRLQARRGMSRPLPFGMPPKRRVLGGRAAILGSTRPNPRPTPLRRSRIQAGGNKIPVSNRRSRIQKPVYGLRAGDERDNRDGFHDYNSIDWSKIDWKHVEIHGMNVQNKMTTGKGDGQEDESTKPKKKKKKGKKNGKNKLKDEPEANPDKPPAEVTPGGSDTAEGKKSAPTPDSTQPPIPEQAPTPKPAENVPPPAVSENVAAGSAATVMTAITAAAPPSTAAVVGGVPAAPPAALSIQDPFAVANLAAGVAASAASSVATALSGSSVAPAVDGAATISSSGAAATTGRRTYANNRKGGNRMMKEDIVNDFIQPEVLAQRPPVECRRGDQWREDCNTCRCTWMGLPSCTKMQCPPRQPTYNAGDNLYSFGGNPIDPLYQGPIGVDTPIIEPRPYMRGRRRRDLPKPILGYSFIGPHLVVF